MWTPLRYRAIAAAGRSLAAAVLATATLFSGTSFAAELVYHLDTHSDEVFSGSVDDLRAAVFQGRRISVGYNRQDLLWLRACTHLSVEDIGGSETEITCHVTDVFDTTTVDGFRRFASPFAIEYHIYSSTGAVSIVKRDIDSNSVTIVEQSVPGTNRREMLWFAD